MATCPNCGNETAEAAAFCDQCGTRLTQPEAPSQEAAQAPAGGSVICSACGAGNVPGEAFCDFCGSPLEAPVPTAEPTPELEPAAAAEELEAPPEPAAEAEAPPPAEGLPVCPACGAEVLAGEAFCATCGASLAEPAAEAVPSAEAAAPEEATEAEPVDEAAAPAEESVEAKPVDEATPPAEAAPESAPEAAEPVEEAEPEPEAEALTPEPEPAVEAAQPPAPAPAEEVPACPACGVEITPGDKFCSNCGAALEPVAAPAEEVLVTPPPPPPAVGPRLVVSASGAEIPLPAGDELLIGREDPVSGIFPEIDLTPHGGDEGGVSRQHARLSVEGGNYFIEDLDSTNFTFVNKQKLAPKTRQPLSDGDEIRCGRVALIVKIV